MTVSTDYTPLDVTPISERLSWRRVCAGKTVVLALQGVRWARQGRRVHVVGWRHGARAASVMLHTQLGKALAHSLGQDPLPAARAPGTLTLTLFNSEAEARAFARTLRPGDAVIIDEADFHTWKR